MSHVTGTPRLLLRLEGLALLVGATGLYAWLGASWSLYAVLFLAPDMSMLGYLVGPRAGAALYNAAHTTLVPLALMGLAAALGSIGLAAVAAVWAAHVGFDRLLGYGLKHATAFRDTHLGRLGSA